MADAQASQCATMLVVQIVAEEARGSQMNAMAVGIYPSESGRASQAAAMLPVESSVDARVSQYSAMVVAAGRVSNPKLRAWTFTLDGHDFYVLRLGNIETLVYDTSTQQWARFANSDKTLWWFSTGRNWLGGKAFAGPYGSNILCGDDTYGQLWFLDPRQAFDDDPRMDNGEPVNFLRRVTGQVVVRKTTAIPCYEVFLTANLGEPSLLAPDVSLLTSDDAGQTYFDHGAITVNTGDFNQRLVWLGLGQITAPGRLFRIEDYGALVRVDALDMTESADGSTA